MPNLTGQSIGRYHILEQLGEGGMATVYKAYDTRLERNVALKVLRTDQFIPAQLHMVLQRFEREAKSLAKLKHPNIVNILDFGEHEGMPYLVMEYLPGGTLKQKLGKKIPWQDAIRALIPVARGLAYAHQHGIIHRDVKPANVLIDENEEPILTDFGIAKLLEGAEGHTLTGSGVGIGTPEYMAPEQGVGASEIDARADIYSLGIVLYEMVTGRKPYIADTPMAVVLKQMTDPLPRPTDFVPDLPENVEHILLKALAKEPDDRYADMDALIDAMEGVLTETKKVEVPGPVTPKPKTHVKKKTSPRAKPSSKLVMTVVGVLAVILIIAFGAPWVMKKFSAAPEAHATSTSKSVIPPVSTSTFSSPSETPEPSPSQSPTKTSVPTNTPSTQMNEKGASILAYISENPPTFQDDFSAKDMVWGSTSEGLSIFALVDKGVLTITDHSEEVGITTDHAIPGLSFPINKLFNATDFVLQYDFSFQGHPVDCAGIQFRDIGEGTTGYKVNFCNDGTWNLAGSDGTMISNGRFSLKVGYNSYRLIVHETYMGIFINDQLIHEFNNLAHSGTSNRITVTGDHGSEGKFDNVKFWNLDGVENSGLETTPSTSSDSLAEWVPINFSITDASLWKDISEGSYSAIGSKDAFAWSMDNYAGDLMVSFDLESSEDQASGCMIIYGNGEGLSYGDLIFCVDWDGYGLEKHTIYHQGENRLAWYPSDVNLNARVYSVTIEIIDDTANMYVNGDKVLSTVFDKEEIDRSGRIGLYKKWFDPEVTFKNIRVKYLSGN